MDLLLHAITYIHTFPLLKEKTRSPGPKTLELGALGHLGHGLSDTEIGQDLLGAARDGVELVTNMSG